MEKVVPILIDFENLGSDRSIKLKHIYSHPELPKGNKISRAYGYFGKFGSSTAQLMHTYGMEPIMMPPYNSNGKNAADIRMVIDALEFAYVNKVHQIVLVSGDSDFIPLYRKLRDLGVKVTVFTSRVNSGKYVEASIHKQIYFEDRVKKVGKSLITPNDKLLQSVITVTALAQPKFTLIHLGFVFKYLLKDYNIRKLGYKRLLDFVMDAESKSWLKYDKQADLIIPNQDQLLAFEQLDSKSLPWLINGVIRKAKVSSGFVPYGLHKLLLTQITHCLEKMEKVDVVSIHEIEKEIMSSIDNPSIFHPRFTAQVLNIIRYLNIIQFPDKDSIQKISSANSMEIIKKHNALLRQLCYKSDLPFSKSQWQSILDRVLK